MGHLRTPAGECADAGARSEPVTRIVFAAVAAAALIRWPALRAEFWFDEILSYEQFARAARSVSDIFFAPALKHDNNHHLNTLVLYLLGDQQHWIVYRVPGALAGLVATAAAVMIARRHSPRAAMATGVLVASSFFVAIYSTEARGYPWLLLAASSGFLSLDAYLETRRVTTAAAFWASMTVGLMAHPTILHFYLGALLWSGFRLRGDRRALARLHGVPVVWTMLWVAFVVRGSTVGGGPAWTWSEIVDQGLAWTFGYPPSMVPALAAGLLVALVVLHDARASWREGTDDGLFYVGALFGPIIFVAALAPPFLFPRYFLVSLFFLLIVTGRQLARLAATSRLGAAFAVALAVLFAGGNGTHLVALARDRASNHSSAVRFVAGSDQSRPSLITSVTLDRWTELPLMFFAERLSVADRLAYLPRGEGARTPAPPPIDWVIEARQPCSAPPAERRRLASGHVVALSREFPVCGPSGMSWAIYRPEP